MNTKSVILNISRDVTEKKACDKAVFRVILCDDDKAYLEKLHKQVEYYFTNLGQQAKIHSFSCMEQISDQLLKSCDIAILDIDFSDKDYSGLDIAKRLRRFREDAVIIFLTNYIEYAPDGYEVQAFRYLLKCDITKKLEGYLQLGINRLKISRATEKIQINGELIDVPIQDILYFESQLHEIVVYIQKKHPGSALKSYRFYSTISQLEDRLGERGFLRVHKSFLVNSDRIRRYQCQEVELDTGMTLRASKSRYAEQKEKYFLWKGTGLNG